MHKPVLLKEVIQYLSPQPGEDFIDATWGDGGHALEILKRTAPAGKLLGIDWDLSISLIRPIGLMGQGGLGLETRSENLTASEPLAPTETSELSDAKVGEVRSGIEPGPYSAKASRGQPFNGRLFLEVGNFADIEKISSKYFPEGVDGVLFDFGFRSYHIDESGRGFSYLKNEPLDMRYHSTQINADQTQIDAEKSLTAADIVNSWPEKELERIFKEFGEERQAKRIAKAIAETRKQKRIRTTGELVEIINKSNRSYKTYSRIFQALRIAVNNELENIKLGLAGAWRILKPGGRLAAISFHSLEDRLVKNFFNEKKRSGEGEVLTRKPITPTAEEVANNKRARSAKLRAISKLK